MVMMLSRLKFKLKNRIAKKKEKEKKRQQLAKRAGTPGYRCCVSVESG